MEEKPILLLYSKNNNSNQDRNDTNWDCPHCKFDEIKRYHSFCANCGLEIEWRVNK